MNTAKKMLVIGGITTVLGASTFASVASAQPTNNGSGDTLASKIAQKFNLNKDDVQKVIDDSKSEHQADRQQKMEDRLNQAVKDGKITAAQKDAITAKLQDMKTYMDSIKDKTADERRTLMKQKMDDLQQWAKDNNLTAYLPMMDGHGRHGGWKAGQDDSGSSTNKQ